MAERKVILKIEVKSDGAEKSVERLQSTIEKMSSGVSTRIGAISGAVGGFVGSLVDNVSSQLRQVPQMISDYLGQAVEIAQERQNALKGLGSIAEFKGVDVQSAQDTVKNLRLVKAGILDVGDATLGLKNLLASGFSLPQASELLERFSDAAAFGKQSALSYGDAIASATEGIKNQNSVLVDNVGVTKNISAILKDRGFQMEDLGDKTKKQSALEALYKGLIEETAAQIGDADKLTQGYTGSISALDNAYKNLQTKIGDYITQSPKIVAAYKIQKEQIEDLTNELAQNGSQTQITANDWILAYAKIKAGTMPFIASISNAFMTAVNALAAAGAGVATVLSTVIEGIITTALGSIAALYNPAAIGINSIMELIGNSGRLTKIEWFQMGRYSNQAAEDVKTSLEKMSVSYGKTKDSVRDLRGAMADVDTYALDILEKQGKIKLGRTERDNIFANVPTAAQRKKREAEESTSAPSTKETKRNSVIRNENGTKLKSANELKQFFEERGFFITSTTGGKHNTGSNHYKGLAVDIRTRGKSDSEIAWIMQEAQKAGIRIFDERTRPAGQKVWGGPHLHGEDYRVSAKRLGSQGFGGTADDYSRYLQDAEEKAVEADNRKFAQENMERMRSVYGAAKTLNVPDAVVRQYTDYLNKDVKRDRDKVDPAQVRDKYFARQDSEVSAAPAEIVRTLELRKDLDEQHISDLRVSLGLEKGANGEKDQYQKLIERERNIMSEVETLLEDQSVARREALVSATVENELLRNRNIAEEANVAFYQERNDGLREIGDIEIRLINLRRTNADDQAREQRQLLSQKREEESLEFSISDLRDRIALADSGINDSLKVQEAYLEDILEIKNRDLAATIEINRATLEMANANAFSSVQVRARVLSEISRSVGSINSALAEGIVSAFEKGVDYLDKRLGKLGEVPIIGDFLKFQNRQTMANVTTSLMDLLLPEGVADKFKESQLTVSDKITKSNEYLKRIADRIAPNSPLAAVGSAAIGGGFFGTGLPSDGGNTGGGLLGSLLGAITNRRTNSSEILTAQNSEIGRTIALAGGGTYTSGQSGGLLSSLFSGNGSIWQKLTGEKFGNNVGTYGLVGTGANLLGNLIGGRFGGALSGAGSGLATGASIGTMFAPGIGTAIGAGVGAAIGFFAGLFGGSKQEKADKQQLPEFNKSFADALAQMRQILTDMPKTTNIDGAVTKAIELKNQIASGFGAQWQSKKYSKQAQSIIASNVTQADDLLKQINDAAGLAKQAQMRRAGAADLYSRILPEFNKGNFFGIDDQMRDMNLARQAMRPHGYIAGGQLGVDRHLGLFADGETIINHKDRMALIAGVGYDPIAAHTNVPNYPKASAPMPKYAAGNFFGNPTGSTSSSASSANTAQPIIIYLTAEHHIDAEGMVKTQIKNSNGVQNEIKVVVEDKYSNNQLKLQKRGG